MSDLDFEKLESENWTEYWHRVSEARRIEHGDPPKLAYRIFFRDYFKKKHWKQ